MLKIQEARSKHASMDLKMNINLSMDLKMNLNLSIEYPNMASPKPKPSHPWPRTPKQPQ